VTSIPSRVASDPRLDRIGHRVPDGCEAGPLRMHTYSCDRTPGRGRRKHGPLDGNHVVPGGRRQTPGTHHRRVAIVLTTSATRLRRRCLVRCRGRFRSTSPDAVPVTHFGPSSIVASSFQLRDSFRCVAPDDPGFGLSVASPGYDFRPASHARIISQLVEGLGLNDWTLMVNDLGNDLALSPALRRL